mgnify:CR=1 FL=1
MPKQFKMEDFAEAGFINDRSGKRTKEMRKSLKIRPPLIRKRGNPALRKFH